MSGLNGSAALIPGDSDAKVQESDLLAGEAFERCREIALQPRILDVLQRALTRAGLVGEMVAAQLVYLAMITRLFKQPTNIALKGPSGAGKSHVVKMVLPYFPESAYYCITSMSERGLAYLDVSLEHKMLVIQEASGISSEMANTLLRCLLSEGRIEHITVDDKRRSQRISKEGPTGLIVTTTATELHAENETRLLSVSVTDSKEQTRAIFRALADETSPPGGADEFDAWHSLQIWLEESECDVTIPFGPALAEQVSDGAVRLRRDFGMVLALIRAHAVLHHATRERDAQDRVVVTLDDYAVVRGLVSGLISDRIGRTVSPATRETVNAVAKLAEHYEHGVPLRPLADELDLDRSAVSRRVKVARDRGYLTNLEDRRGKPARLALADAMPGDAEILPTVRKLEECCTVAVVSEGVNETAETLATDEEEAELERARAKLNERESYNERLHAAGIAQTLEDVLERPYIPDGSAA